MISGIVLASGYSRRLKRNKLLVEIEGEPLVRRITEEICRSDIAEVIVVYREEEVKEAVSMLDVQCVKNLHADRGMSESLKLGILSADKKSQGFMFFVGDQVFLNSEIINEIIQEFRANPEDIIIPICEGKRTNPVCFPGKYRDELLKITGDEGGRQIIRKKSDGLRFLEIDRQKFCIDIDTEEDIVKANQMIFDHE